MSKPSDPGIPKTVVLIHGLWLTALCWEHWVERYRKRGFDVVARSWPGLEGDIEDIRNDPSAMAHVGLGDVVDHYEKIIHDLGQPVIIMGHSFGGLVTQLLLDRGQGAAGVAIDSAAPKGVFRLPPSEVKSNARLQDPSMSITAYKEFPGRSHYIFGQPGWEEVADFALDWALDPQEMDDEI